MKYKIGDKVKIKSLKWYDANKDGVGNIKLKEKWFVYDMSQYCGKEVTIKYLGEGEYRLSIDNGFWSWTDEMLEDLIEPDVKITIAISIDSILKKNSIKVNYNEESNEVILTADKENIYEPRVGDYVTIFFIYNNTSIKAIITGISDSTHLTYIRVSADEGYDMDKCYTPLAKINPVTPEEKQEIDTILSYWNVIWNPTKYKLEQKRWRAKKLGVYYYVTSRGEVSKSIENNYNWNDEYYQFGNYFRTEQQAKDKAEQLKKFF